MKWFKAAIVPAVILGVLLMVSTVWAVSERFEDYEGSKTGKMTKEDFMKNFKDKQEGERRWKALTKEKGDYCTLDEWQTTCVIGGPRGEIIGLYPSPVDEYNQPVTFQDLDTNKDGKVSKEEFLAAFKDKAEGERRWKVMMHNKEDQQMTQDEWNLPAKKK